MSDAREAGMALDALVSEHIFGMKWCEYEATGFRETRNGTNSDFCRKCGDPAGYHFGRPAYSTSIAAAWTVVEAMGRRGFHCRINTPFEPGRHYFVGFTPHSTSGWNGRPDFESGTLTAPRAICLAALKAVAASPSRAVPDPAHTPQP